MIKGAISGAIKGPVVGALGRDGGASIPANTVAPVVSGTAAVGQTLSCTTGTWTGAPAPTYTYQWRRDGSNIGGATASTYALVVADAGTVPDCVVTATNTAGSASQASNALGAVFSGPLDLLGSGTPIAAYGFRRLKGAYTGNLCRLRRASDDAEQDFTYTSNSNGEIDASAVATFKGASSLFVVTLYDQSGNANHATMATKSRQPAYSASLINSKPCTTTTAAADSALLCSPLAAGIATTTAWTLQCLTAGSGNSNRGAITVYRSVGANDFDNQSSFSQEVGTYSGTATNIRNFAGSNPATPASGAYLLETRLDGANIYCTVDGTDGTGAASTGALNADSIVLHNRWVSSAASGYAPESSNFGEHYVFSGLPSSGDRALLRADLKSRFATA